MEKEKEKEVTLEELQQQVKDVVAQNNTLKEENAKLKEDLEQEKLKATKMALGGVTKQDNKVEKEDEEISFDFDY